MLTIANSTTTYNGLSTDQKPTNAHNGDSFLEMDTATFYMYDEENTQWEEVASGGGGGGNTNSVQTITGTLENPWGDVDFAKLKAGLINGDADARLRFDATALGFEEYIQPITCYSNDSAFISSFAILTPYVMANEIVWDSTTGGLEIALVFTDDSVVDLVAYASLVPSTLYIFWHPMPADSDENDS